MAQVLNRATMLARAALGKGSILGTCKLFCEMFVSLEFLNQNIFYPRTTQISLEIPFDFLGLERTSRPHPGIPS